MEFLSYLKAGYPLLYVETFEEDRVISSLSSQSNGYKCYIWDIVDGLRACDGSSRREIDNPVEAISTIVSLPEESVLYVKDAHRFLEDLILVRTIKNIIIDCKSSSKHICLIAPILKVPIELQKDITIIPFDLPSVEELCTTARRLMDDNGLDSAGLDLGIIGAAKGLTINEAENAFARSLITKKIYDRGILEEEKLQAVKKSGLAEVWPAEAIANVGGLEPLKAYLRSRAKGFQDSRLPQPRGILLAGLPGSGKSLVAKAAASVLGMPLIRLDLGTLKGSLVGESEANMRKATQLIDAISPCVVWLDEIEKSLSGVQSSGKTDGGTGSNMFGQLLTWMQESTSKHYIVATCNDMDELLSLSQGALIRRFDDIFFVDLPSEGERREIINIMIERYKANKFNAEIALQCMGGWTGAEIEKCVKNSLYDGMEKAIGNIRPISLMNRDKIQKAREWARFNAIMANEGEVEQGKGGRAIKI